MSRYLDLTFILSSAMGAIIGGIMVGILVYLLSKIHWQSAGILAWLLNPPTDA